MINKFVMGCYNSIEIDLPADIVWARVNNFHDMSWSTDVIKSVKVVGDVIPPAKGAKRVLNGQFYETLLSYNNESRVFTYSIDDGPGVLSKGNVDGYVGSLQVFPIAVDNTSLVLWTSGWAYVKSGNIEEFCDPIYQALLIDMKTNLEKEAKEMYRKSA